MYGGFPSCIREGIRFVLVISGYSNTEDRIVHMMISGDDSSKYRGSINYEGTSIIRDHSHFAYYEKNKDEIFRLIEIYSLPEEFKYLLEEEILKYV